MERVFVRSLALVAAAASVWLALPSAASAITAYRHTIGTTQPAPDAPGIYLSNLPGSYYMGRLMQGETFDREDTSDWTNHANRGDYHWGYAVGRVGNCAWLGPPRRLYDFRGYLNSGTYQGTVTGRCDNGDRSRLRDRATFGRYFNCADHQAKGPMRILLFNDASFYYTIDWHTDYSGGSGTHYKGVLTASALVPRWIWYRYTTPNGYWAVIYDASWGWGFVPASRIRDALGQVFKPQGQWSYEGQHEVWNCGQGPL